jgi:large subunit ribosomal protein L32
MGALPNKKVTRSRQGKRFTSYRLKPVHPSYCPQCRSAKRSHTACPKCGYYKGRQVMGVGET